MPQNVWWLATLVCCAAACGCAGTSQDEMKRRAIVRVDDEEEEGTAEAVNTETPATQPANIAQAPAKTETPRLPSSNGGVATSTQSEIETAATTDAATTDAVAAGPTATERPQTVEARRQWTIDNLTTIGKAIEDYYKDKGHFPPAYVSVQREPLLSWRVELLPYLGYGELYQKFHRDEQWNSQHNLALVAQIPSVYQSPERMDEKTNYLAAAGSNLGFDLTHGRVPSDFVDGLTNTVLVLEVDDEFAVTWTEPRDYDVPLKQLPRGLGKLREDGYFVLWGGGVVSRIALDAPKHSLVQMLTIDSGDAFRYTSLHNEATAAPAVATAAEEPQPVVSEPDTAEGLSSSTPSSLPIDPAQHDDEIVGTLQPPSESEQQEALETFRELYEKRFKESRTKELRSQIGQEMMDHVEKLSDDPARRYVLLELTLKVAASAGDLTTALEAAKLLSQQFAVRPLEHRSEAIRLANKSDVAESNLLIESASEATEDAINIDDYDLAREMFGIAQSEDKRQNQGGSENHRNQKLITLKRKLDAGERGFRSVTRAMETIESDPDDPQSNRAIGEYYCLIKGQWSRGLPLLARGNVPQLVELAQQEMQAPRSAEEFVSLADGWWRYGDDRKDHRRAAQLRAAFWYQAAVQQGRNGLPALKAEVRLREAEERYGREALDEVLGKSR